MQTCNKMIGRLIAVAVLALSLMGRAELTRHNFPNADQSWDLARVEAWGDGGFPTSEEAATLTTPIGTYHVSSDVNLNALYVYLYSTPSTNIVDQTAYPDVTVSLPQGNLAPRPNADLRLVGGKWDLLGTGIFYAYGGWNVGYYNSLTLDGVTAVNVADMRAGDYTEGSRLILTNGSHVTTASMRLWNDYCRNCFYGQYDSTVVMTGGSGKSFAVGNKQGYDSTLLFCGSSVFTNASESGTAYLFHADSNHGNVLRVDDGAKVYFGNKTLAYFTTGNGTYSNRLAVAGASSLVDVYQLSAESANPDGWDNSIDVRDGGTLSVSREISFQAGMDFTISNGTLRTPSVYVGKKAESKNIRVFVQGAEANLDLTNYWLFNAGHNHLWEFDGSTCLHPDKDPFWACGQDQSSNVVRLVNGANVGFQNLGIPRGDKSLYPTCGNELFVGNDSTFGLAGWLYVMNDGNRVVVSNGTLKVNTTKNTSNHFILGHNASGTVSTNCALVLQGTKPKVTSGYSVVFWQNSWLKLDLPEENLRLTEPLIETDKVQADATMHIRVNGWETYQKNLTQSVEIPVIYASGSFDANTLAAVAEANERLVAEGAQKVYFHVSADNKNLYLHVHHPPRGMMIIFR